MIIGISGPSGAGKDTAADFIEKKYGYKHVSGGDILREMLRKLGFDPKKEAIGDLGTLLRNNYGANAILKLVIRRGGSENIVNSGFRSPEEARLIKEAGGVIFYINASDDLRHKRILLRGRDGKSVKNIRKIDEKELQSNNKLAESLIDVREMADYIVQNNTSIEHLHSELASIMGRLFKE